MAPSRRKGAGKAAAAAAAARKWKVGDLVLAKVKGFPAWPAMVSEPEKWGYSTDWKKVMVYFFGTQQIAFCNPADVQAFTEEKKHSLLTKRHGKGSDFVRAVKEIIESYEKLKNEEQANDQKSANDATPETEGSSAEPLQARENPPGASLDTRLKSDSAKGGDKRTLYSEDASAAEQMLALRGNNTAREQPDDSVKVKETPKIATYSSRKRNGGVRSQKRTQPKKASSFQQSKSSSMVEMHRFKSSMFVGGLAVDDVDDGAVRRRKRIRRRSGTSESDDMGSSALNSNGSDEEDASEIATVESDNILPNGGNGVDSVSKFENSNKVVECLEGDLELDKGLDIQIKAIVVKKKRKPTRKRGTTDAADPPVKADVEADMETGTLVTCHSSQNSHEDLSERPSKENGDEHLPLVKRARVRMSRAYNDDEVNTSSQVEERDSMEAAVVVSEQAMPLSNHDNNALSNSHSFVEKESVLFLSEVSVKIHGDTADVVSSAQQRSSDNTSPSKSGFENLGNEPEGLKVPGNQFSNSPHDEPLAHQSKQFSISSDGKAALSSPSRCVVEAMSARVAEEVQACSGASSTMNTVAEFDIPTAEVSHETNRTATGLQLYNVGSFANDVSELRFALNSSISEEPTKSSAIDESQKRGPCDVSLVKSADCLDDKCCHDDTFSVQTVVQSQTIEHSSLVPSSTSMMDKSTCENFRLRERPGSPSQKLDTSNQINQDPVHDKSDVLSQCVDGQAAGHSNCTGTERSKPQDVDNSQQNNICEVVEITMDRVGAANSISVNDIHSCEKMSLSPTDLSGSPVRGTPHSNSFCHISTAESANIIQHNGGCSPNVHFHERRILTDTVIEEGERIEAAVSQRPKFVGLSSNYAEAHAALLSFEGSLGSLVRTKESIGRATRLAMDCTKLGVSAKVMEILANNLENESNLQRRVDLFFLVDSIAQCSKSVKGDAGGVYLSAIQAMLPRLLFATAPPGAPTQENRRQCLKVLRLWLERRILPESVICHHIRELDSHSNSLSACLYSRRSARTERALDDPVRDMEGMLVDEYGSNSTLQLPGFCMPSLLKDEDEGSDSDGGDFEAVTPEHNSGIPEEEQQVATSAAERHTRILEDVDGELEMEDVAPSCEIGISTHNDVAQDDTQPSSHAQFGQQVPSINGPSLQDVPSSSPPLPVSPTQNRHPPPPPPPSLPAQCAVSDPYNSFDHRGYSSIHGDHPGGASRIKPPMPANSMQYQGPESTSFYSDSRTRPTSNVLHNDGSNFQHRPHPPCPPSHPPPPPPPPNHFSYMQPGHHTKSRRDMPPYSHRSSHYMPSYDDRNFHENHERMRPGPYESRENWRYPPPSSYGPRYHDKPQGPYDQGSYGGPPREPPRVQNQRWNHPSRPFNHHRNSFHYKPHSEGPVPVGMRDPGMWHQR